VRGREPIPDLLRTRAGGPRTSELAVGEPGCRITKRACAFGRHRRLHSICDTRQGLSGVALQPMLRIVKVTLSQAGHVCSQARACSGRGELTASNPRKDTRLMQHVRPHAAQHSATRRSRARGPGIRTTKVAQHIRASCVDVLPTLPQWHILCNDGAGLDEDGGEAGEAQVQRVVVLRCTRPKVSDVPLLHGGDELILNLCRPVEAVVHGGQRVLTRAHPHPCVATEPHELMPADITDAARSPRRVKVRRAKPGWAWRKLLRVELR